MAEEKIIEEGMVEGEEKKGEEQSQSPFTIQEAPVVPDSAAVQETKAEKTEGKYNELLSKVSSQSKTTTSSHTDEAVAVDAKSIGATVDEESKIQMLIDLANTKGVVHAVKVARSLKDYYALDKMHDELADKLYERLIQKGLIKEE